MLVISQSLAQPRFSYDQAGNRVQRSSPPDLVLNLVLLQANFGANAAQNFVVNIFEVVGTATSSGTVELVVTAPVGYTLSFNNSITTINVFALGNQTVNNPNWTATNIVANRQITVKMNAGQYIAAGGSSALGFTITRTTANSGSTSSITASITNDSTLTYDSNSSNNIYARIINAL
ncbi:hypothetical protein [Spirosoma telluris]